MYRIVACVLVIVVAGCTFPDSASEGERDIEVTVIGVERRPCANDIPGVVCEWVIATIQWQGPGLQPHEVGFEAEGERLGRTSSGEWTRGEPGWEPWRAGSHRVEVRFQVGESSPVETLVMLQVLQDGSKVELARAPVPTA